MTLALVIAGFFGAAIVILAYFGNQQGWLRSEDWRFPALNLLGSVLIVASLFVQWNFQSAVIEAFWIAISVYGLVRNRFVWSR
ncbi:MAG: CBU_0592 family membrane protein [Acetobacteraceae bacterium]